MNTQLRENLRNILIEIFQKKANFYKIKYLKAEINKKDITNLDDGLFKKLPLTLERELADTPYKLRNLKEELGLNKLVFLKNLNKFILVHKPLEEIKKDSLPLGGSRPMVIMQDSYEAFEYCLFFYQQGILPLIGEIVNPAMLYANAAQYRIDSLVLDLASKKLFQTELLKSNLPLKSVTIVDSSFSSDGIIWPEKIDRNYILALPEFGKIVFLCKKSLESGSTVFHSFEDVFIEPGEKTVLTSGSLRANPMIRYQSSLHLEQEKICLCGRPSFRIK